MNFNSKPKKIVFSILTNLTFWVLIAILIGVFVGHYTPDTGVQMKVVGDGFISIIKLIADRTESLKSLSVLLSDGKE